MIKIAMLNAPEVYMNAVGDNLVATECNVVCDTVQINNKAIGG